MTCSFPTKFEWRQWLTKQFSVVLWALESFYLLTPHMVFIFWIAAWMFSLSLSRTTQWNKKREKCIYLMNVCTCCIHIGLTIIGFFFHATKRPSFYISESERGLRFFLTLLFWKMFHVKHVQIWIYSVAKFSMIRSFSVERRIVG